MEAVHPQRYGIVRERRVEQRERKIDSLDGGAVPVINPEWNEKRGP
jgi:hypothetical protein